MRSFIGLIAIVQCYAQDPSPGWLSYASFTASPTSRITALNATWTVMAEPIKKKGSNAPGWWFGIQTADGNGALIQPILAWADGAPSYTIFNGIYDWNDQSWTQSISDVVTPGQTIIGSVTYRSSDNSYDMIIRCKETGWSVTTNKKIQGKQIEATAYFVLEHAPVTCAAYPPDNGMSFSSIYLEVDNQPVVPSWKAHQETPKCASQATIVSPSEIKFSWDATAMDTSLVPAHTRFFDSGKQTKFQTAQIA